MSVWGFKPMSHVMVSQVSLCHCEYGRRERGLLDGVSRQRSSIFLPLMPATIDRCTDICFKYWVQNKNKVLILNTFLSTGLGARYSRGPKKGARVTQNSREHSW